MDESLKEIILAALLHDIGKLAIRAGEKGEPENHDIFLPHNKEGRPTHIHAYWSNKYIEEYLKGIPHISTFAYAHHIPIKKSEQYQRHGERKMFIKIIKLADWLSSGERREKDEEYSSSEVSGKKQPLISIFSLLKDNSPQFYHPVTYLNSRNEALYPTDKVPVEETPFKKLWDDLTHNSIAQFGKAEKLYNSYNGFNKLLTKILSLLEKYTLFVPSATYNDNPDISLFHHLKTTSAIAACLYKLYEENKLSESKVDEIFLKIYSSDRTRDVVTQNDFILLAGDISGIQDFIYSVTTDKALKGLRGRSYYLQLLTDAIARYIVQRCGVSICNILFLAGGHFTILLPNTPKIKNEIDNIEKEINNKIYSYHKTALGIVTGYVEFSYSDFLLPSSKNEPNKFENVLNRLHIKLSEAKRRKFSSLFNNDFFKPKDEFIPKEDICEICSNEPVEPAEENEERKTGPMCKSFEKLSQDMINNKYLCIKKVDGKSNNSKTGWQALLEEFGYEYSFKNIITDSDDSLIFSINDVSLNDKEVDGFVFIPLKRAPALLSEIADKSTGIKRYAALKMDVDNLSTLKPKDNTVSRFSMFSYMLNLFFSFIVKNLVCEEEAMIVYSGGDDLFILGRWDYLPELALKIRQEFEKFVRNPSVTLSAGIFIPPAPKFPVFYSAKQASEELENAKSNPQKNSISFLTKLMKWCEFDAVNKLKDEVLKYSMMEMVDHRQDIDGRALIRILSDASDYNTKNAGSDKDKANKAKLISKLRYALTRYAERYAENNNYSNVAEFAKKLVDTFISQNSLKENLDVAAQWADYLTRKEEEER